MAACVLALLVVMPTVTMATCVCKHDAAIGSVETDATILQAIQSHSQDHGAPCEAACCVGGHCHHGGAMLDAPGAGVPSLPSLVSEHVIASAHALASRTLSGPDRPPRA